MPVKEELEKAFSEVFACEARKKEIEKLLAETEDHKKLLAEYDFLERRIESLHGYSWKKDMETMFQKFGFALEDLEKPIGEFSGGQQTKIALIHSSYSARTSCFWTSRPTTSTRCSGVVGKLSEKLRKCRCHCIT